MAASASDEEIEYLEEDAEIVQKCVQSTVPVSSPVVFNKEQRKPLILERPKVQKRKKKEEEDSEYDPSDDNLPPSPPSPMSPPLRKKKVTKPPKKLPKIHNKSFTNVTPKKHTVRDKVLAAKELILLRKKYNIRIPDYDDPLCLPVRAIKTEELDTKRLNNWNNVCLEHFKHYDTLLKPEKGETMKSIRTTVFQNVVNKKTGINETSIWSKTCVVNKDYDKKSEIFQCILPRYKEKRVLNNYILCNPKYRPQAKRTVDEAVLNMETRKDGEVLVVYKPKESVSAVYKLAQKNNNAEEEVSSNQEDSKMYLKELAACQMCVNCYQGSWRGVIIAKKKSIVCPLCSNTYVTVYNLLAHFKTHSAVQIKRHRKTISAVMANIVGYHYKCRVCCQKLDSIKALRLHIKADHQSKGTFICEVCNRLVNNS